MTNKQEVEPSRELKPCPFCGSEGVLYEERTGCMVKCQNTHNEELSCDMGISHCDWTKAAAIEMWNRRTTLQPMQDRIKELEGVLGGLVNRLYAIHEDEQYKYVWFSYANHGGDYSNGPTYTKELEAGRQALNPTAKTI